MELSPELTPSTNSTSAFKLSLNMYLPDSRARARVYVYELIHR